MLNVLVFVKQHKSVQLILSIENTGIFSSYCNQLGSQFVSAQGPKYRNPPLRGNFCHVRKSMLFLNCCVNMYIVSWAVVVLCCGHRDQHSNHTM